jgi:hypothetical protein
VVQPSISPAGTLTFKPAAGAFGSATVTVQLQDDAGTINGGVDTSAAQTFSITIQPLTIMSDSLRGLVKRSSAGSGLVSRLVN